MRSIFALAKAANQGAVQASLSLSRADFRFAGAIQEHYEVLARRSFASDHHSPAPPTPDALTQVLMKVVPPIVAIPRLVVNSTISATGNILSTLGTSGVAKQAVSWVADNALLAEPIYKLEEQDIPSWVYWLSTTGYNNKSTYQVLADTVKSKIASLPVYKVVDLVVGFHTAKHFDKEVFDQVAAHIKENLTEYDTEGLFKIVAAFSEFGYYEEELFDDIADSITYCNSMYASEAAAVSEVATVFEMYAKHKHNRGDLFNALQRGLWTLYKKKVLDSMPGWVLKDSTLKILRAFQTFDYWPYNAQMVMGVAKKRPDFFTSTELSEIEAYADVAESHWGKLTYYREGYADWKHYHEHAQIIAPIPNLYAFDDSLVAKEYSPAALRVDLHQARA